MIKIDLCDNNSHVCFWPNNSIFLTEDIVKQFMASSKRKVAVQNFKREKTRIGKSYFYLFYFYFLFLLFLLYPLIH